MNTSSPALLVGLQSKMERVSRHWAAVDASLPPAYPLLLLAGVGRGAFNELDAQLSLLRNAVNTAELELKLARAAYEQHKAGLHRWLRSFSIWMRGGYRGTHWFVGVRRVPGIGQSYGHWQSAAEDAVLTWRKILASPLPPIPGGWEWSRTFSDGRTVDQFAEALSAFEAAWWDMIDPELDLKMARGTLEAAQHQAAELLMAYGHGVRARLGSAMKKLPPMPRLWPRHKKRKSKAA